MQGRKGAVPGRCACGTAAAAGARHDGPRDGGAGLTRAAGFPGGDMQEGERNDDPFWNGGWRAVIGDGFTKANVQLLTLALARKMLDEAGPTRASSSAMTGAF